MVNVRSRDEADEVIGRCLRERVALREVVKALEAQWDCELSELDCRYVEGKYTEIAFEQWMLEVPALVTRRLTDPSRTLQLFQELNSAHSLRDCKHFINGSVYGNTVRELVKTSKLHESQEKQLLNRFKQKCLVHIQIQSHSVYRELQFYQCCLELLKTLKIKTEIGDALNVISCFMENPINEQKFRECIVKLKKYNFSEKKISRLKNAGEHLLNQDKLYFIENFIKTIKEYAKPCDVSERSVDGRAVLQVSGKHIVISNVLTEIERMPRFTDIEEVRFVDADVVHADADFMAELWHGKNIVVSGEALVVSVEGLITWNISGRDAEEFAEDEAAGTGDDGTGLSGKDGKPGESGGNVLIIVNIIENGHNLIIKSNGGKGGKGQDGGKSLYNKVGEDIDRGTFRSEYPLVSKHSASGKITALKKTVDNILRDYKSIKTCWFSGRKLGPLSSISYIKKCLSEGNLDDMYIEAYSESGSGIEFSFYKRGYFSYCQSFLLLNGSPWKGGKPGGIGGLGGEGGFPGEISIHVPQTVNISKYTLKGLEGEKGEMSLTGIPEKTGLDRGYMDSTNIVTGKWPKYFEPSISDDVRLEVRLESTSGSERVFCPYKESYAEIKEVKRTHNEKETVVHDSRYDLNQRQCVQAARKKTISLEQITEQYRQNTSDSTEKRRDIVNKCNNIFLDDIALKESTKIS